MDLLIKSLHSVVHFAAAWNMEKHEMKENKVNSNVWLFLTLALFLGLSLRNLARWGRRHRHQRRVQVTWRIPAGLCWWLWQSVLVLLPLLSAKGQSRSLSYTLLATSASVFLFWHIYDMQLFIVHSSTVLKFALFCIAISHHSWAATLFFPANIVITC